MLWRLWSIVRIAIAIIPQQQLNTLAVGVAVQLDDAVAANLLVPPVIDQHIFIAHSGRQVNHLHLVIIVDALVLPDEPAPCIAARLVVLRRLVERVYYVIGNSGLYDGLQRGAQRDGTPRGAAWQWNTSPRTTKSLHLSDIGESDGVTASCYIIAQVTGAVVRTNTRLADEHPTSRNLKQTRKGEAFAKC